MASRFLIAISFSTLSFMGYSERLISKEEYKTSWSQTAVRQMIDYKIPASITLAQGILESGSGNSSLAKNGNNHFGIKCHDWTGEKMYLDDDTKNECFRVYPSSEESFLDHSKFLSTQSRYSKLFTFESTDYRNWANGLKLAGYATNPKYPELLIEIIENLKLYELDLLGNPQPTSKIELSNSKTKTSSRAVSMHSNNVTFITVKKGDTFYRISKEFNLGLGQLYRYNDFDAKKDVLIEGDIIYLEPKRRHSKTKLINIVVNTPMSLRQISQKQAIKLKNLMRINNIDLPDEIIKKGEIIRLK